MMLVISKKRILFIISVVCVSLLAFSFKIAKNDLNNITTETVALPVSNKVIVLDAGHGRRRRRS